MKVILVDKHLLLQMLQHIGQPPAVVVLADLELLVDLRDLELVDLVVTD